DLAGTPPDPAPPEVPPRGPSHHHPLLTAQRRAAQQAAAAAAVSASAGGGGATMLSGMVNMNGGSNGQPSPQYLDNPDDNYQQPTNTVFLSHADYLVNGTNARYGGSLGGAKSPGGSAFYGPPPGPEFSPTSKSQPR
ncbi:hypothetical protein FHG87_001325, partial [Trinorchestia longiramus]